MKKLSFFIVLFFISLTIGCANYQTSTKEEALYVIEHTEDFQELIQYISLSSFGFFILYDPYISESIPKINMKQTLFVHQAIYKTKEGENKLIFLSDENPPKILATIVIK